MCPKTAPVCPSYLFPLSSPKILTFPHEQYWPSWTPTSSSTLSSLLNLRCKSCTAATVNCGTCSCKLTLHARWLHCSHRCCKRLPLWTTLSNGKGGQWACRTTIVPDDGLGASWWRSTVSLQHGGGADNDDVHRLQLWLHSFAAPARHFSSSSVRCLQLRRDTFAASAI
jgi:hypothetical protein